MMSFRGSESIADFADKIKRELEIKAKQLERLNRLGIFEQFTEKVIAKYNSDRYRDCWHKRGIDPPEDLFWFL
jgi:hypothetical protein